MEKLDGTTLAYEILVSPREDESHERAGPTPPTERGAGERSPGGDGSAAGLSPRGAGERKPGSEADSSAPGDRERRSVSDAHGPVEGPPRRRRRGEGGARRRCRRSGRAARHQDRN